jgi:hypothetical protein
LSKSTFFSTLSFSSQENDQLQEEDDDDDDDEDDLNSSIDGLDETDEEEEEDDDDDVDEEQEEPVVKVVAKIKHGTIMNGKGEFVNKGSSVTEESSWLDEARANRKVRNPVFISCYFICIYIFIQIADLEIEKASLLVLNTTLEAKLRQQTSQIVELQKRLQM